MTSAFALTGLLRNKWLLGGLAAVLVVGAASWHFYQKGKEAGQEKAKQEEKERIEVEREAARAKLNEVLASADAAIAGYKQALDDARQRELRQAQVIASIQQQRQEKAEALGRLPDSALHGYIVKELALRDPADGTAGYYAPEERAIAKCVADHPGCLALTAEQGKQLQNLRDGQAALEGRVAETEKKVAAFADYTEQLETYYTTLYNLFPKKKRSPKCLWLWGCAKTKLSAPDPAALRQQHP